jgi:hypothetical protein
MRRILREIYCSTTQFTRQRVNQELNGWVRERRSWRDDERVRTIFTASEEVVRWFEKIGADLH